MATDRLSNFKLGMGVVIKADTEYWDVGRPSSCNAFAIATLSSHYYYYLPNALAALDRL